MACYERLGLQLHLVGSEVDEEKHFLVGDRQHMWGYQVVRRKVLGVSVWNGELFWEIIVADGI